MKRLPLRPAELGKSLPERRELLLPLGIIDLACHQHADPTYAGVLLRAHRMRPSRGRSEQRNELAPPHSITSSANEIRPAGIVRPSALAVLRLMTNSNL